jgi:hypothetical protein
MSAAKSKDSICCPVCRSELSLEMITSHLDDEQAFTRLVALSVPMAHLVVSYVSLFAPEKQSLTLRKKVRIIAQLLPDLQRQTITHKGRDWAAPLPLWGQAIEQMLTARAAGRLSLPLTAHSYLYAVLAGLADKQEASAEALRESERRSGAQTPRGTVTVRGVPMGIGQALETVYGQRDPALAALDASTRNAAPMPDDVRAKLAALRGKPATAANPTAKDAAA